MTAGSQEDILNSLQSLSLGQHKDGLGEGSVQGAALLKLLQGGPKPNGFEAGALATAPSPLAAPPAQPDADAGTSDGLQLPQQAVSSLFGAGGSIWSSQSGPPPTNGPVPGGGGLWGSLPPATPTWPAQESVAGNRGQQTALHTQAPPHMAQLHATQQPSQRQAPHMHALQQPGGAMPPPPGMQVPLGMHPPPGMPHHAQQQQPQHHAQQHPQQQTYQPPLHLGPQQHLPAPQHPGLRGPYGVPPQHGQHQLQQAHLAGLPTHQQQLLLQGQPGQHGGLYPAAPQGHPLLQHMQQQQQQQQHAPVPHQQAGPRPSVVPYTPLSSLLQSHGMPPPQPPHMQQAQLQAQHVQQAQPRAPLPGGWAGGHGALFAGLPAMQQLAAQQQQLQQQAPGAQPGRMPLPGEVPPASPRSQAAGLQPHRPSPPPGMQQGLLPGMVPTVGGRSPPPAAHAPDQHGAGDAASRQHLRAAGTPTRKPGTQHVPKAGSGRENRWVDVMDRQHDGRQPKADMRQLNAALTQLADSLMPTQEERGAQMQAFELVRSLLQARYPGARVHLFGSVANGLSVRHNNDLDVCLELEQVAADDQAAKGEVAVVVGELMEAAGMADVLTLPKARVPVVKFVVPRTLTKVDVTVNNLLACINTKLLGDYCAIDPRLAPLVALVKHWAKQRAVNDPYRGTLSSYCYVLMCIFLLQTRPVPVLPVLQQLPPNFRRTMGQWTCEFCDDVASLRGFGSSNTESLAELLWAFFEYWAWRHNYSQDVVSIRLGRSLTKDDKDWTRRIGNERHLVCIEDPFELVHDLGRTVDRQTRAVLHKEFTRAATLLRDAEDPLDGLFAPYRVGHRG